MLRQASKIASQNRIELAVLGNSTLLYYNRLFIYRERTVLFASGRRPCIPGRYGSNPSYILFD